MYHSYLVISLNRQNVLKPDPYFLVHLIGKISTPHDLNYCAFNRKTVIYIGSWCQYIFSAEYCYQKKGSNKLTHIGQTPQFQFRKYLNITSCLLVNVLARTVGKTGLLSIESWQKVCMCIIMNKKDMCWIKWHSEIQ